MSDPRNPTTTHPTDDQILAWVDEGAGDIDAHLTTCFACRARVEEMRGLVDGIRNTVELPDTSVFRAQREQIRAAIEADAPPAVVPIRSRRWSPIYVWAPVLAAAAIAGLLLIGPGDAWRRGDPVQPVAVVEPGDDPVIVESAHQAAEEALAVVEAVDPRAEEPGRLDLAEAIDTQNPVVVTESEPWNDEFTLLAEEFAALSQEEQSAVLDEMEQLIIEL